MDSTVEYVFPATFNHQFDHDEVGDRLGRAAPGSVWRSARKLFRYPPEENAEHPTEHMRHSHVLLIELFGSAYIEMLAERRLAALQLLPSGLGKYIPYYTRALAQALVQLDPAEHSDMSPEGLALGFRRSMVRCLANFVRDLGMLMIIDTSLPDRTSVLEEMTQVVLDELHEYAKVDAALLAEVSVEISKQLQSPKRAVNQ